MTCDEWFFAALTEHKMTIVVKEDFFTAQWSMVYGSVKEYLRVRVDRNGNDREELFQLMKKALDVITEKLEQQNARTY